MARPKYTLLRQNDAWIAAAPGYLDPSNAPVGRGATEQEAIEALAQQPEFQLWLRENKLPNPTRSEFSIEPSAAFDLTFRDSCGETHGVNPSLDKPTSRDA